MPAHQSRVAATPAIGASNASAALTGSKYSRKWAMRPSFTERTRRLARQAGGFSNGSWNRVS